MTGIRILLLIVLACAALGSPAAGQTGSSPSKAEEQRPETAPVIVDGVELFRVRGVQGYPAGSRADAIADRIRAVASDDKVDPDAIKITESDLMTNIAAGKRIIASVFDADAALEGVPRQVLAQVDLKKVRAAVREYRLHRSSEYLLGMGLRAAANAVVFIVVLLLLLWAYRLAVARLEVAFRKKKRALQLQELEIVPAQQFYGAIGQILRLVRAVLAIVLLLLFVDRILFLFPWTRLLAARMLEFTIQPLQTIASGIVLRIPDLIFIAIAVILARALLKIIRIIFAGMAEGKIALAGFHPEWAMPTFKLVRLLVVMLTLIMVFPYIPGSQTDAFKGISLFIGLLFSLGSSSTLSNLIAGYALIFRRTFKVGDFVGIGDLSGYVTEMRLPVTHLKTIKNEEIIVPNSLVLNSNVINYSSASRARGLFLHTNVTIGYDTPWRQVHGMLLDAATRTEGILKEPAPFVHQKSLDDFYVTYELNACAASPVGMQQTYSLLHQNIQDEFNRHGVQIMSPHYRNDPKEAKVVPKECWYAAPAKSAADPASDLQPEAPDTADGAVKEKSV